MTGRPRQSDKIASLEQKCAELTRKLDELQRAQSEQAEQRQLAEQSNSRDEDQLEAFAAIEKKVDAISNSIADHAKQIEQLRSERNVDTESTRYVPLYPNSHTRVLSCRLQAAKMSSNATFIARKLLTAVFTLEELYNHNIRGGKRKDNKENEFRKLPLDETKLAEIHKACEVYGKPDAKSSKGAINKAITDKLNQLQVHFKQLRDKYKERMSSSQSAAGDESTSATGPSQAITGHNLQVPKLPPADSAGFTSYHSYYKNPSKFIRLENQLNRQRRRLDEGDSGDEEDDLQMDTEPMNGEHDATGTANGMTNGDLNGVANNSGSPSDESTSNAQHLSNDTQNDELNDSA